MPVVTAAVAARVVQVRQLQEVVVAVGGGGSKADSGAGAGGGCDEGKVKGDGDGDGDTNTTTNTNTNTNTNINTNTNTNTNPNTIDNNAYPHHPYRPQSLSASSGISISTVADCGSVTATGGDGNVRGVAAAPPSAPLCSNSPPLNGLKGGGWGGEGEAPSFYWTTASAARAELARLASKTPRLPPVLVARTPLAAVRAARASALSLSQRCLIDLGQGAAAAGLLFHPTLGALFVADARGGLSVWDADLGQRRARWQGSAPPARGALWPAGWTKLLAQAGGGGGNGGGATPQLAPRRPSAAFSSAAASASALTAAAAVDGGGSLGAAFAKGLKRGGGGVSVSVSVSVSASECGLLPPPATCLAFSVVVWPDSLQRPLNSARARARALGGTRTKGKVGLRRPFGPAFLIPSRRRTLPPG